MAPFLWLLWTGSVMYYAWKVARRLRETRLFPIAIAIVWYAFAVLFLFTYTALDAYQNYVSNVYLWVLLGILFRLPDLLVNGPAPAVIASRKAVARRGFRF